MIHNKDRSGWFGASDTAAMMGKFRTKTFERFWLTKLGIDKSSFESTAMKTGTFFEGKILDFIGVKKRDRQIKIRPILLRVNLDGESDIIHEVKTYSAKEFKVSSAYWQQAQVEMFASKKPLEIVAYRVLPDDYKNWFSPIDPDRISRHKIEYDKDWVFHSYLPRLIYLAECLREKRWPNEADIF